jgi:hypothetical protein
MNLTSLFPKISFWGSEVNVPVNDGLLRAGYWSTIDPAHTNSHTLGQSTAIIEFDLKDLPRGLIIASAILFIDHVSAVGTPPDVSVYAFNRKAGNPSDWLGSTLSSFYQISGAFKNQDIILDVTDFIQSTYNGMGLNSYTDLGYDWSGVDFVLGSSSNVPGYRSYIAWENHTGGSHPQLWITSHTYPMP